MPVVQGSESSIAASNATRPSPRAWQPGEPLVLRPHNVLCLQSWQGMGYSPAFTANMDGVWHYLRLHPDTEVTLRSQTDVLCGSCPNNSFEVCDHDANEGGLIWSHDARTLARLGLEEAATYVWRAILEAIAMRMAGADIASHCAFCRFQPLGVCAAGVETLGQAQGSPPSPPVDHHSSDKEDRPWRSTSTPAASLSATT